MQSSQNTDQYDNQGNRTESGRDVFSMKTSKNMPNQDNLSRSTFRGGTTKSNKTYPIGGRLSVSPNGGLKVKTGNPSEKLKKGVHKVKVANVLGMGGAGHNGGGPVRGPEHEKKVVDKIEYKTKLVKRLFKNHGKMDKGQIMGKYYEFMSKKKLGMSLKDKLFLAVSQNQISEFED